MSRNRRIEDRKRKKTFRRLPEEKLVRRLRSQIRYQWQEEESEEKMREAA